MSTVTPNQSFNASASGSVLQGLFGAWEQAMDTNLLGMGRNVTMDLKPARQPCPDANCKFNSMYKKYVGSNNKICETCKGQGFLVESRQTTYIANIRWTNEPYYDGRQPLDVTYEPGRPGANYCITKMNYGAMDHIKESIGATIDGTSVELYEEPRYRGFGGQLKYVVAIWKSVNR